MGRKLRDAVIVITGASSGIGAATALAFARERARLMLAARDPHALAEVAARCDFAGGRTAVLVTDVADPAQVNALAARAIATFGRIDVWINNAGVYSMGALEDIPEAVHRRVLDTNLLGTIHGAQAAMRQFRKQREGRLINVGSVASLAGYRYGNVYNASKFGVRGLTEALRQEVHGEKRIHVSLVCPPSVDTPLFEHAANYTGQVLVPMKPVYAPERVAAAIVRCARSPRRLVLIGGFGWGMRLMHALLPGLYERTQAKAIPRLHLGAEPALPTDGNLFLTQEPKTVRGGWLREGRKKKLLLAAAVLPVAALAAGALRR
jgi:NAD(P)-dependent dehydrogenase (short-subunit alcohol dehydrogenase family)